MLVGGVIHGEIRAKDWGSFVNRSIAAISSWEVKKCNLSLMNEAP